MSIKNILIALIATLFVQLCYAQTEDKPLMPNFRFVTVNPLTGKTTLSWERPRYNPLYPDPIGYIIYNRGTDEFGNPTGWFELDKVDENTFSYTDNTADAAQGSISYSIASDGTTEPSPLSAPHATIHLTAFYDSCYNGLSLEWSHYVGWGNKIKEYHVYWGEGTNLATFNKDTVQGYNNKAFIDTLIAVNKSYNLFVEAIKEIEEEGEEPLRSRSNLALVSTKISDPPKYLTIDSLSAGNDSTVIHFKIDPLTEYRNFSLVRWEQVDSIRSIFSSKKLFHFTDPGTTYFADTSDSWAARSRTFYYKINAFDGCNRLQRVSDLVNTMILRLFPRGLTVNLSWDSLYSANKNSVRYKIYRQAFNPEPLPPDLIFDELNPSDNEFVDNVSNFSGQGLMPKFCYYIEAYEQLDNLGNSRLSRSRSVCTEVAPEVAMPNALDPSSDLVYNAIPRNVFAPTISFSSEYKLIIYNRWGGIVYQGENQGWDGRMPNGDFAKEGTYIYRVEVYTPSLRIISKTGYLTVIYGPK